MDNFREWVSDNLRYILLGAGVFIVVLVLIFAVRAMTGSGKSKPASSGNQVSSAESGNQTASGDQAQQTPQGTLEKDAVPEVSELVRNYYKALGEKNIEDLKSIVKDLDPAEESKIANTKYIESYENVEVYTEKGMEEGSYVVFASFAYKCTDVETAAPALSQLYVITDEDDKLWISAEAVSDPEIQAYVSTVMSQPEVIQLRNSVQASYDQAQAQDPQLKAFLERLVLTAKKRSIAEGTIRTLFGELYPYVGEVGGEEKLVVYKTEEAVKISELLKKHRGNRKLAAEELGISTTTLWRKMNKYGIESKFGMD